MRQAEKKERNPLLLVGGASAWVNSRNVRGSRIYHYDLPAGAQMGIAGELEPTVSLAFVSTGELVLESPVELPLTSGQTLAIRYRNALSAKARIQTQGLIILIPRRLFEPGSSFAGVPDRVLMSDLDSDLLIRCVSRLYEQVAGTDDLQSLSKSVQLLVTVLAGRAGTEGTIPPSRAAADPSPWYVSATESYLEERLSAPLSIHTLAQAVGISARTLHDGFRKHKGCSPMKFLRDRRLTAVRNQLLFPHEKTSVTEVAMRCGFNHLGRFSAYYAEVFGELPSDTLAASRMVRGLAMSAGA